MLDDDDDGRVRSVAKALCVAEGQDPDAQHLIHEIDENHSRLRETSVPRWTAYAGEARRFIAAAQALGLMAPRR